MNEKSVAVPVVKREDGAGALGEGVATLVDKPKGWSSFKVVALLRRRVGIRKIGHAGTLDPMATGLLICCIGRSATRQIERFMGLEKEYEGVMRLGESTSSYDAESKVTARSSIEGVTDDAVRSCFGELTGPIDQVPPMYSAVKVDGKRLYKLARKGVEVERRPRTVTVNSFELLDRKDADAFFRVVCTKGTYVRTLAHDVGVKLGVGAHLVSLRRTRIGSYRVERAFRTEELEV